MGPEGYKPCRVNCFHSLKTCYDSIFKVSRVALLNGMYIQTGDGQEKHLSIKGDNSIRCSMDYPVFMSCMELSNLMLCRLRKWGLTCSFIKNKPHGNSTIILLLSHHEL